MAKKILLSVVGLVLVTAIGVGVYIATACPCDRLPGVALTGDEAAVPVADWTFVNQTGLCQLQVSNGIVPQSLNLNCMSAEGDLYISCSQCDGKRWSSTALVHTAGRIRIEGIVYPVSLRRVTDPLELDVAWAARAAKLRGLGRDVADQRPDHWWSFELTSR